MIEIMKASAGSGKTFNLAKKYITLLFQKGDPHAYRHILAVTFTNKATDEMKTRILKQLHILATETEKSPYLKWLVPEHFSTPAELKKAARAVLSNILNDYSAFSISTIDRFFQQTLKAFSREMGQFASYQVELDKNSLVQESVDRLLDSLSTDNPDQDLLRWLTEAAMEQIEGGDKYNLESGLMEVSVKLKSEELRTLAEAIGEDPNKLFSKDNLRKIQKYCKEVGQQLVRQVSQKAQALLDCLDAVGVAPELFNRKFMAQVRGFAAIQDVSELRQPTPAFMRNAADPELWFSKANSKYLNIVQSVIDGPLADFCDCFDEPFVAWRTAGLLQKQFYKLGIASDLYREFDSVLKDRNVLSIDDTNVILKKIIAGSDAPFIYEKTGVRFENFLLDEFQDTSAVQWDNFKPLIRDSVARGEDNLVVGDVKQSIYRWRGSDWDLLRLEVNEEFKDFDVKETTLMQNFRSRHNIVDFNNRFFSYAAKWLDDKYGDVSQNMIADIYSDVSQEVTSKESGSVRVTFCAKENELDEVLRTVSELNERGVKYSEMAVLVRTNASGNEVASALIANDIPVITDDSLSTKSSSVVGRAVALMSTLDNRKDELSGFLARSLDVSLPQQYDSLPELCEAILRELKRIDPESFNQQVTYVYSFADTLLDYVSKNGNDLHGFLKAWRDSSPNISSPSSADAVRIITVHKAKGLDFRYVIFPFAEKVTLYKKKDAWCALSTDSDFGENCKGIYSVSLSKTGTGMTYFEDDFMKELRRQYIDNINTFYVALTRAVVGMHIIAKTPTFTSSGEFSQRDLNMSSILYQWLTSEDAKGFVEVGEADANPDVAGSESADANPDAEVRVFEYGDFYAVVGEDGAREESAGPDGPEMLPAGYDSYPLNPGKEDPETGTMARLTFSADAADWFDEDAGGTGEVLSVSGRSARIKGIVLHEILSEINTPADIEKAVRHAVRIGSVEETDEKELVKFFEVKIGTVARRGWFPETGAKILNEAEIVDSDGSVHRPDRVILRDDGSVEIIDYKFGSSKPSYRRQISRYSALWRRMGYTSVTSHLWYVLQDRIES